MEKQFPQMSSALVADHPISFNILEDILALPEMCQFSNFTDLYFIIGFDFCWDLDEINGPEDQFRIHFLTGRNQ